MKPSLPVLTGILFSALCSTTSADTWLNLQAGVGSSEYDSAADNIDTSWAAAIQFAWLTDSPIEIVSGIYGGAGTSVASDQIGVATEFDEELSYWAVALGPQARWRLSPTQSLFAGAALNYNATDVDSRTTFGIDEQGFGYNIALGWDWQFGERLAMNLSWQRLGLSEVDVNSANLGLRLIF